LPPGQIRHCSEVASGEAMSIYAISDLHLSLFTPKPMDIFGPAWEGHAEKIKRNWLETVSESDTVLLPGDSSWAMRLHEAMPDLNFIADLPGSKVLIRGNHDYWWHRKQTSKIQREVDRNMTFLQGTSTMIGDIGITGTRGWRIDWETRRGEGAMGRGGDGASGPEGDSALTDYGLRITDHSSLITQRELTYLENGLKSIPSSAQLKIAMLHFPPFDERLQPNDFAHLLVRYSVDILVYGHVHLGLGNWLEGPVDGVNYHVASADIIDFKPKLIVP